MIKKWLAHPLTAGLDIDNPQTTELRRQIIREKSFLRQIYQEWYTTIHTALPSLDGLVLELGSGAGFLKEFIPDLIASDIFFCANNDVVLDGAALPFSNDSLRAIVMTNVLHHLPQPRRFFTEAARCVKLGGAVIVMEPWVTPWSRLIYTRLHHEPFVMNATQWDFPRRGPLSGANGALPHIIFARDRSQFEAEFPMWHIQTIKPLMPFRYLVSGGVSLRTLMPGFTFRLWQGVERILQPWMDQVAMFALIILERVDA